MKFLKLKFRTQIGENKKQAADFFLLSLSLSRSLFLEIALVFGNKKKIEKQKDQDR